MQSILKSFVVVVVAMMSWCPGLPLAQEAVPDTASVIDTQKAWENVSAARQAASQDRHHDAVADYLLALANDARLVEVVAKEIAYQKLWREDADKAIFYFHRYLARHPDEEIVMFAEAWPKPTAGVAGKKKLFPFIGNFRKRIPVTVGRVWVWGAA